MSEFVLSSQMGHAYRIELNRPDCGNLVTTEMVFALTDAVSRLPAEAKLLVLSGKGADFCRGRDPQTAPEAARGAGAPSALELRERMAGPIIAFYTALKEAPVPTLAVVQGAAHGFGSAMTGACDIALAGEGSRFRLPEMTKGLPPTLALAALDKLTAKGLGYLVYSTAEVDARAALAMGLVSAVFPDGALNAEAGKLIETISSQPLAAVKAVKEFLKFAPLMEPRGRADFAASVIAGVLSSR
jgi:enoyl-CoA hydratase/carnithine racemase